MSWSSTRKPSTVAAPLLEFGRPLDSPARAGRLPAIAERPHVRPATTVTIIVPTYREAENLPHLIDLLAAVRDEHGLSLDLLIVDDDSRDGSDALVAARPEPWIELIVRTTDQGLSRAVLDGMQRAKGEC